MSSSDSFPDWGVFSERPVSDDGEILSPAAEIAAVLQKYHADLAAERQRGGESRQALQRVLAAQAVYVFQMEQALQIYQPEFERHSLGRAHRHLRVLKDQMRSELAAAGLEIEAPVGRSFEDVVDFVQVDGWRHDARYAREEVAEVIEPVVKAAGELLRPGRVVMGAPAENAPKSEQQTREDSEDQNDSQQSSRD